MLDMQNIENLYIKYKNELLNFKTRCLSFFNKASVDLMIDDIESELTYLLVREFKPENIIEFSPNTGVSTYILHLATLENNKGTINTYDIVDKCTKNFKLFNMSNVYFHLGDVTNNFKQFISADYLFIDSLHTTEFGQKYINELLIPLTNLKRKIPISVHDVYHPVSFYHPVMPEDEGKVVTDFLSTNKIPFYAPHFDVEKINIIRNKLQIPTIRQNSLANSMIYFEI